MEHSFSANWSQIKIVEEKKIDMVGGAKQKKLQSQ